MVRHGPSQIQCCSCLDRYPARYFNGIFYLSDHFFASIHYSGFNKAKVAKGMHLLN